MMTTESVSPAQAQPFFGVQRIFLKGASLELPSGSSLFLSPAAPAVNLAIQVESIDLAPGVAEVTLRGTLTGSVDNKPIYLVEVEQAGIFEVRDASAEQKADMLEIGGPSILGPYLRAQIADMLTRATLPAFFMPEINWPAVAADKRAKELGAAADKEFREIMH